MQPLDRIKAFHDELTRWRRDIHAHPELGFEEQRTVGARRREARGVRLRGASRHRQDRRRRRAARRQRAAHDRAARRHGRAADPGGQSTSRIARRTPARCTPAATTATRRCCSAPRATWPRRGNFDGTVHFIFQPAEEGLGGAQGHDRGRPVRALPVRRGLRHAQPAGPGGRQIRDPLRPDDGGRRLLRHRRHRHGRAWRAAGGRRSIRCSSPRHITTALQAIVSRNVPPGRHCRASASRRSTPATPTT